MKRESKKSSPQFAQQVPSGVLRALLDVGTALSAERSIPALLNLILEKSLELTGADGATLHLVEKVKQDTLGGARPPYKKMLRFYRNVNRSNYTELANRLMELTNHSIVGYVALSGESLRIRDCYVLGENAKFSFNPEFDRESGYRTKSMLVVPIKTAQGKVLGVLQIVNKLRGAFLNDHTTIDCVRIPERYLIAFSEEDDRLAQAFASQAAVALENAQLTENIENLFESFVRASISAIETRDPTTSGHSDRVARMTVEFSNIVSRINLGPLSNIEFSDQQIREIRYAALLHDFGKIGVQERVLLKAQKLYPHELETVLLRLDNLQSRFESYQWRQVAERIAADSVESKQIVSYQALLGETLIKIDQFLRQIKQIRNSILQANESQVLSADLDIASLMLKIEKLSRDLGQTVLNPMEMKNLSIPQGTLNLDERREIESHVSHTFSFLKQIAWTEDLSQVPEIAHAHHEKLDGTGYPRRLIADQIPIQSRMMTIVDIYDALTAMDRPYKSAVSVDRALDILHLEMEQGKLDRELLRIFTESKIYRVTQEEISRGRKRAA